MFYISQEIGWKAQLQPTTTQNNNTMPENY